MTQDRHVAVITGASSGIGLAAAKTLAGQGWHVIAHGRVARRSAGAQAEIAAAAAAGARVDMVRGDLALLSDTARIADDIAALTDRVDVLLNNAGGVRAELVVTAEGNEATFAGNHLGHFLLTRRLLPLLRAAAADSRAGSVRVVNTTSDAHGMGGGIDFDDLQGMRDWSTGKSYCLAKLCNVLFTRALAGRLEGDGIAVNAYHPGVVASNFASHADARMGAYLATLEGLSPEAAAAPLVRLITAADLAGTTGAYFEGGKETPPGVDAQNPDSAERLWRESEKLVERAGF